MDFETLQQLWDGAGNRPDPETTRQLTETMMHDLKTRRRRLALFVAALALGLTAWTGIAAYGLAMQPGGLDLSREGGAVLLLALSWIALAVVELWRRRHGAAHADPYATAPATLRALMDENAMARRRVKFMAVMVGLGLVAVSATLVQAEAAGRMTWDNVASAGLVMGLVLALVWGAILLNYFRRLRPEAGRLRERLNDYDVG
ncbi:MAG: hypothetical protein GC145_15020 [Caulobacter sp.]|nr:hypothetical protein [Caulobacter sp.]